MPVTVEMGMGEARVTVMPAWQLGWVWLDRQ